MDEDGVAILRHCGKKEERARLRVSTACSAVSAAVALQALRHLGPDGVTDDVVATLSRTLSSRDKAKLDRLLPGAPAWLHLAIKRIAAGG